MPQLIVFVIFVALTYIIGFHIEKKHYHSIKQREKRYLNLPVITTKDLTEDKLDIQEARLVYGSAVISIDYFKRILAGLRNIFGGEVSSYETLLDRARREAILRMKQYVPHADIILNLRLETARIGQSANQKDALGSIEVLAYGTAVTFKR